MASPVTIANAALRHLGAAPISTFEQLSPAGEAVRGSWELVRDDCQRSHRWNFAKELGVGLSEVAGSDGSLWQLPADCLRVGATCGQRERAADNHGNRAAVRAHAFQGHAHARHEGLQEGLDDHRQEGTRARGDAQGGGEDARITPHLLLPKFVQLLEDFL